MSALGESQRAVKEALLSQLRQLAEIAESAGMRTLAGDITRDRIPKLESERFHVVVLGEFNHGKSTFVNAVLGASVLPAGITPTTATINRVVHADQAYATAVALDGKTTDIELDALAQWVTVEAGRAADLRHVDIGYPAQILKNQVVLVDTPGVNDLNEQRAEITYGYVPRADAVLFLLDAGQALKDSEREFLSSHVLEGSRERLVFVLGKIDLLRPEELAAVTTYVRKGLADLTPEPMVFPVSAKSELEGDREASGFAPLMSHLETVLSKDRARVLLDNAAVDASRTANYLAQNLGLKMHACSLDLADLERRVESVRDHLETSKRKLDSLHQRIVAEAAAIKAQARLDLKQFAKAFTDAVPGEIDAVDAEDVKRFLGAFIEDTFRDFAEREGEKLGILLEQLAEEVITVTNENAAEAAKVLAGRLGPADTDIQIDIDSFKYDVGVYAVGALGTTMMFFVNALAGGLLTLAAPILSILVKSKIAGDIKAQAKERVPAVVARAADAMGPHLDQCVDDFASRLSAFVTAAGNALYKGISEILDRTIEQRREGENAQQRVQEQTGQEVTTVSEIRTQLDELRASLWHE